MNKIVILGSTGSIGTQSLEAIKEYKGYEVVGLSCGNNIELLKKQIIEFKPKYISTANRQLELENEFKDIVFYYGDDALLKMASIEEADTILNSLVGSIGLLPTLEAIKKHKKVLLSNKETLVIGGEIVKEYLKEYNGTLYPIDSEHSSLWELIEEYKNEIDYVTITASGGPFRDIDLKELDKVNINDALHHPNWKMGKKISIDSATMMNKGFEVIEAHYLFDLPLEKIKTIINLESLVHSTITLKSGKTIYGVDSVSMKNPIVRALYYPEIKYQKEHHEISEFHFREIDNKRYPCLELAYKAMEYGGINPTILNACNEASVNLFLNGEISFTEIYKINNQILEKFRSSEPLTLENILKYDKIIKDFVMHEFRSKKL